MQQIGDRQSLCAESMHQGRIQALQDVAWESQTAAPRRKVWRGGDKTGIDTTSSIDRSDITGSAHIIKSVVKLREIGGGDSIGLIVRPALLQMQASPFIRQTEVSHTIHSSCSILLTSGLGPVSSSNSARTMTSRMMDECYWCGCAWPMLATDPMSFMLIDKTTTKFMLEHTSHIPAFSLLVRNVPINVTRDVALLESRAMYRCRKN